MIRQLKHLFENVVGLLHALNPPNSLLEAVCLVRVASGGAPAPTSPFSESEFRSRVEAVVAANGGDRV